MPHFADFAVQLIPAEVANLPPMQTSTSKPSFSNLQEALVSRISKKIEVLKAEQICLREETKLNDDLGRQISVRVMQLAQPNECEKYKLHVEETDKIASLIFGLAGRLAKTENSLLLLGGDRDGEGGGGDAQQKEKVRWSRDEIQIS